MHLRFVSRLILCRLYTGFFPIFTDVALNFLQATAIFEFDKVICTIFNVYWHVGMTLSILYNLSPTGMPLPKTDQDVDFPGPMDPISRRRRVIY